jgi:hypothetical protein
MASKGNRSLPFSEYLRRKRGRTHTSSAHVDVWQLSHGVDEYCRRCYKDGCRYSSGTPKDAPLMLNHGRPGEDMSGVQLRRRQRPKRIRAVLGGE